MLSSSFCRKIGFSLSVSLGLLFIVASVAHSTSGNLAAWNTRYPDSTSASNAASCQLCHASSTQNLNPYGKALCDASGDIATRILAVENANSDADSTGSNNLTEINADSQPGWTYSPVPTYSRSGSCSPTGNTEAAPAFIAGLLDPVPATTTTTLPQATTTTTLPPTSTTTTTLGGGGTPTTTTTTTMPTTATTSTTTTTLGGGGTPPTTTTLAPTTPTTTLPSEDLCPDDPNKTEPGVCGCGITDVDSDSDGIEDCIDNAPYNSNPLQTDTDGDGVGDEAETGDTVNDHSVASLLVNYGQDRVTLSTAPNNSLENVSTLSTDQVGDLPAGVIFPFDLFGFTVTGFVAGDSTTVTINLPDGEAPTTYWKYGPTPLDGTNHWYEFLYDGATGAELNGNVITLHFVDGERGDHDLDPTNGIIDDPGGPAFVSFGGGSSSSGCFIATAAYGSYMEPHVMTLRQFRDSYLLTNRLGTTLVEAYYKYSPPMANYIAQHGVLRSAVRVGLTPLVGFSWLAMNYGMIYALAMLFSMLTIIIGVTFFIVRIREAN